MSRTLLVFVDLAPLQQHRGALVLVECVIALSVAINVSRVCSPLNNA